MGNNEHTTICDKCFRPTWYETEQPCKRTIRKGCATCGSHENISKEMKCPGTLRIIDTSALDPRLTPFYKRGERIEVTYLDGTKDRFWIGKCTGWRPAYLEIKRLDSYGGEIVLIPEGAAIRGLGVYR